MSTSPIRKQSVRRMKAVQATVLEEVKNLQEVLEETPPAPVRLLTPVVTEKPDAKEAS